MSAQEFIASGVLHVYVLGATTPDENREVELMAAQWPEVKAELERLQLEMEAYAQLHTTAPRPELREQLIANVLATDASSIKSPEVGRIVSLQTPTPAPATGRVWKAAAILAGILLISSVVFNIITYGNLQEADNRIAALESEKSVFALQTKQIQHSRDSMGNELTAYRVRHQAAITELSSLYRPSVIALHNKENNNQAVLFWCSRSKTVCIDPGTLPNPESNKQYQLWAIVNGKPVDVGVFEAQPANQLQILKIIPEAQAFAITVEKQGGVPAPEGPMVAIANL